MYSYFTGILAEKTSDSIVVEVNGIGWELKIPLSTYNSLPEQQATVKIYVYTHQTEDDTRLFGFFTKPEKELFKLLININKIGPKLALALMSHISINDLLTAIVTQNHNIIAQIPGFGKKTAERLIVELKDKIDNISSLEVKSPTENETNLPKSSLNSIMINEVENALTSLGYKSAEIRKTLSSVPIDSDMSIENIVKACIKYIYLKRNEA